MRNLIVLGLAIEPLPDVLTPTPIEAFTATGFFQTTAVVRHLGTPIKPKASIGNPQVFAAALSGIATIDRQRRDLSERKNPTRVTGTRPAAAAMNLNTFVTSQSPQH